MENHDQESRQIGLARALRAIGPLLDNIADKLDHEPGTDGDLRWTVSELRDSVERLLDDVNELQRDVARLAR
jgi:hypothetical protein